MKALPSRLWESATNDTHVIGNGIGQREDAYFLEKTWSLLGLHATQNDGAGVTHQGSVSFFSLARRHIVGRTGVSLAVPHRLNHVGVTAGEIDATQRDLMTV